MEGPLAHATRRASERRFVERLDDDARLARYRSAGAQPERRAKRVLVDISHAVEKAVLAGRMDSPTIVVSLFQQMTHFDRERAVYAKLAAAGARVVVGFVAGTEHPVPEGVALVRLSPDEPLADEWTVVACGPHAGAFLVATDQHSWDPAERGLEAGRLFDGRWGFSHTQTASELARLRFALGDRLEPGTARAIDRLLSDAMPTGAQQAGAGTAGEMWATTSLYHMIDRMQDAHAGTRELRDQLADAHRAVAARGASDVDPGSGLPTGDFLDRWNPRGGPGGLPVGVALVDVPAFEDPALADERAAYHAGHRVAAALTHPLGPVDVAVRLGIRTFAVVVPGASARHLGELADRIAEGVRFASPGAPGVPLAARIAMTVTTSYPLPVEDLYAALARVDDDQGPVDAGATPGGHRIWAASSAAIVDQEAVDPGAPSPTGAGTPSWTAGRHEVDTGELDLPRRVAQQTLTRLEQSSAVDLFADRPAQ